jgi:pSer/pThr/pTyr-binding forkhead associated (FHA) protein
MVLGRATNADFPIQDPTISRRHAELEGTPTGIRIKDLGSSNGTFLNGAKLEEKVATPGQTVTFGKVVFTIQGVTAAPEPKASPLSPVPGGTIVRAVGGISAGSPALPAPGDSPS